MARIVIETPCPDEVGVEHPNCHYLAHIVCTKCGWIQGPHECVKRRVLDPGSFVLIEKVDGEWPDWVLVGLGWTLDDSHDLAAVMDGIWRERPR